jgi:hypothetical protein
MSGLCVYMHPSVNSDIWGILGLIFVFVDIVVVSDMGGFDRVIVPQSGHSGHKIAYVDSSTFFCGLCPFCYTNVTVLCWLSSCG